MYGVSNTLTWLGVMSVLWGCYGVQAEALVGAVSGSEEAVDTEWNADLFIFDPDDKPLDIDRLWLPLKYKARHLDLVRAAKVTLMLDRCEEIKRGTLDLDQSTPSHPKYRILCLQPNGKTYSEIVDGISFEPLVTNELPPEAIMERKEPSLASTCWQQVQEKVRLMLQLEWVTEPGIVQPQLLTDAYALYRWDFNAQTLNGDPLEYKAECNVGIDGDAVTKISSRRVKAK